MSSGEEKGKLAKLSQVEALGGLSKSLPTVLESFRPLGGCEAIIVSMQARLCLRSVANGMKSVDFCV